ncbi:hypothetical protein D3875_02995 [Deinococcus cavernae]|uniref:Tetratricopeptide repeat protein n=1 Tax=Deinococcus cavernae TaxID=2320857 RepID=A0A418VFT3_9DEIO|nr:hypothetical protein [Deinococcus cavernae]RJF74979.1 hypothetical protein D3875_02995 [Deinococcus cavernae]
MKLPSLAAPCAFDAFLSSANPGELIRTFPRETALEQTRFAQVALATGEMARMTQAAKLLEVVPTPPARGVRMMLHAQMGDYLQVALEDTSPTGHSPLELEDACYASSAHAVMETQLGNYESALCHLAVAAALGRAVGLHNRVSMLEIEKERMLMLQGKPRPEELQRLMTAPMSARRLAWGRRTWAESLMALGDYPGALRVLGLPTIDGERDRSLRRFLHALLNLPIQGLGPLGDSADYDLLARAIVEPCRDAWPALRRIKGEPQSEYARQREALHLLGTPGGVGEAAHVMGQQRPPRGDQSLMFDLFWLHALTEGHAHPDPSALISSLVSAPLRLRETRSVLQDASRFLRETLVLISLSDLPKELHFGMNFVPLLTGGEVLDRGQRHRLPGRIGRLLTLEGAGIVQLAPAREEKRRYANRLQEIGVLSPLNMGRVIARARQLEQCFAQAGDAGNAALWQQARARATQLLTRDVRQMLENSG